ncbi:uncharacterized protein LOC135399785 [Ornithodoros turicata]|uniref:uncharacterized protein LOC135399785 n=1 Tax=Ornithodoros turicata TaxID=34597 RepID=UPI003139586E
MKLTVITLALATIAQAHVLVPTGTHFLAVGKRPLFVVPPYHSGVSHVNPFTVIFLSPETVDRPKDVAEKPDAKVPAGEEPAVAAKPAFPAQEDAEDGAPSTEGDNNGDRDEVLDVDGPLEQPKLNEDDGDDGLGFKKPGGEEVPGVFAKPAFNDPTEVGDGEATEDNNAATDDEKKPTEDAGDSAVSKDPYVPYVRLPSGLFSPVLEDGATAKGKGGKVDENAYYVGYVVPPVLQGAYPYFAPHVVYRPAPHAYVNLG